jgi:hypothetical protein
MLRRDQPKLAEFRTKISHFKNGQTPAAELIESFFTLFDRPAAEVGSLIKELADIFEITSKRDELLKAWNDWKAINEDYPSLPGSSTAASASNSVGGKRVLKLKKSTAQSAHSAVGRAGGWGNTSTSNLFPALPATRMTGGRAGGVPKTAWAGATPSVASTPAPRPVQPARTHAPTSSAEAFPALPAATKPVSSAFTPSGRNVIRTPSAQPTIANPWGPPGAADAAIDAAGDATSEGQKRKGNKNKKQTLMHWG